MKKFGSINRINLIFKRWLQAGVVLLTLSTLISCSSSDVGEIWGGLNELIGVTWRLESYGSIGQPKGLIPGTQITLEFERDNQIQGFGGCNNYFGNYTADDDGGITIYDIGANLKHCGTPEGVDAQETDYLYLLGLVMNYEINSDGLFLYYDNKQSALHFKIDL